MQSAQHSGSVKVLLAVDGSESATTTVDRAKGLLPANRDLIVLSVVHAPVPVMSPIATPAVGGAYASVRLEEDMQAQLLDAAQAAVATVAAGFDGESPSQMIVTGDPGTEICRVAADEDVDVVVVGSHGAGALARMLLGSVSDHVVHHAPCPVLVIRQPDEG